MSLDSLDYLGSACVFKLVFSASFLKFSSFVSMASLVSAQQSAKRQIGIQVIKESARILELIP